jgi:hypothetical protein
MEKAVMGAEIASFNENPEQGFQIHQNAASQKSPDIRKSAKKHSEK